MLACVGAVHPFRGVPEHGVKGGDHLAHDGDDGDLWLLSGGGETLVKAFQRRVER